VIRGQELEPPTTLSLMYTENGGKTWGLWPIDEIDEGYICPGYGCIQDAHLEFSDPRNGWLVANAPTGMSSNAYYLYRTRDGGQSWTVLVKTILSDGEGPGYVRTPMVRQLTFVDPSTGWAIAESRWGSFEALVTQDGGNHWNHFSVEPPQVGGLIEGAYYYPVFISHDSWIVPVRFYGGEDEVQVLGFYVTDDAGKTWSLTATLEDPELDTFYGLRGIPWSAIDESTWFVAVSESRQYLTRDGGQTWEMFPAEGLAGYTLTEVQFVSEAEGWGLGTRTRFGTQLFATHDGGRTWEPIAPAP